MFNNKINYGIVNLAALMLLLYIGVTNIGLWIDILGKCISVLAPFIIAFAFAYAFTPLVRWLDKKGLNKGIAITIVVIGLVVIVLGIIALTLPLLYDQLKLLAKTVVEVMKNFDNKYNINLGTYEIEITDYLNDILKNIGSVAGASTVDIVNKSLGFIGKFIVGFVGFIYFLIYMENIRNTLKAILKASNKRAFNYIRLMDTEITNYLKGLETFMVIQLFEYSLLFLIVGHPNWLVLGILACITTIVPYFGGLITNIIAIILASVISSKLFILTIIICLIFPQLDGYIISPKVYGRTNNVNPLITIMAVSIGGTLAGPVGIIVALPCYLLLRTTFNFFKMDLKKGMVKVKETI